MRRLIALVAATVALLAAPAARNQSELPSWTAFGNGLARTGAAPDVGATRVRPAFYLPLDGRVTAQVLAASNVRGEGTTTFVATTSDGRVAAFDTRGYVHWTRDLGQLAADCPQLDGYGVTGTGALDPTTKTLYVADAFGRIHALDLADGSERAGWPVRVFTDTGREHVWGALLLVDGRIYVPTGSYCDTAPMQGHVYMVDTATRSISSWSSVPPGVEGGGIWGWGGLAYSAKRDSLFAAVGNAFAPGHETAGYGEHLVELSPRLDVRAASTTPEPANGADADLVGSPVVVDRAGCGELVVAARKDGRLFAWRSHDVATGPLWAVQLERFDLANPVLAQPAYDARLGAIVVVTGARVVRVDVAPDCTPHVIWSRSLGTTTENGLPTIAGSMIWVALSGRTWTLAGIDLGSGTVRSRRRIGGPVLTAPTIVGRRIVLGSFAGGVQAFVAAPAIPSRPASNAPEVRGHTSGASAHLRWESRSDGVYATADGGAHWRRIFDHPALRVVRTSSRAGAVVVGEPPPGCTCHARIFWTSDGGGSWHESGAVTASLAGAGTGLFWRDASSRRLLRVRRWPPAHAPLRSRVVATATSGRFADIAAIPGGAVGVLTARVDGQGWDVAPRVVVSRRGRTAVVGLPHASGDVLVRTIDAAWPTLVVRGANFDSGGGAIEPLVWRSRDGGRTWTLRRG